MIILAVIALITFPVIDNSIKSSREKSLERTIDSIEEAAYRYSIENDIGYPSEQQALYLSDIQSKGFLSSSIINPVTNEELSGCVWYYWDTTYNQYVFEYDMECVKVDTEPVINIAYDESLINSNGWAKENITVTLSGNGEIKYCISSSECEPNEIVETGNNTKFITTEGTSYLCALTSNSLGSSDKECQSFKLDKTLPTINNVGDLTVNRNEPVNLSANVTYNDALSGIDGELLINPSTVDTSTVGTKPVTYSISDKAGNIREVIRNIIVDAEAPTITFSLVDSSAINENGWAKSNFYVRATITDNSGTGIASASSCTTNSSSECEPIASFTGTTKDFYIESEGSNRACIQVTDNNNKTTKICSDTYKLDKTVPTAGTATFAGTLGSNNWYTTNVTVNVANGSDSLSGHSNTSSNISSITSNTTGTTVTITTTDLAGNSATRDYLIKLDKDSPSLVAKSGIIEITEGDSNVVSNYFNVSYSISGGSISCTPTNTSTLTIGSQTVSCTATGGNGLTVTASKEIFVYGPLIDILMGQYDESKTTGLVQDETNPNIYYYTGTNEEVSNNYLWYGGHHWRVVEIDTDANTLLLISQQPLTSIDPASAVWTTQETYESSYINTWLNDYFYNSLDSSIQNNIVNNTFNVGIYTDVDEIATSQKVGLLDEDQYARAGGADSYLDIKDIFWLGNRYNSSTVRSVYYNGNLSNEYPASTDGVRAVMKISNITITGGNGTLTSNYEAGVKATNTNDIQVGEYINVPYSGGDNACGDDNKCTFRVVSKDSDSIKVVLNGLLPTTSAYGDTTTITTNHTIYTSLNMFANNISSDYRYTGNKMFYIGDYPYVSGVGQNYTVVQDETLQANVGLPTVGEMFSGNDIDMSASTTDPKIFVNVATIENPTASYHYWTMNRYSSSYVLTGSSAGGMNANYPTFALGARAVIYLKSGTSALTFTGGKGTAEEPYELQ